MPTALFVERDREYIVTPRSLRFSCERAEWDDTHHRARAIGRAWALADQAIRSDGGELVTAAPVTLLLAADGWIVAADIRTSRLAPRQLIDVTGQRIPILPRKVYQEVRTTYRTFAEGPLIHLTGMTPSASPLSDRDRAALAELPTELQRRALRAIEGAGRAGEARTAPTLDDIIDFRIRCFTRQPDLTVLVSKQSEDGSKLVTDDLVWDGRDGELAVEDDDA